MKERKNIYSGEVAVKGAKMAVILVWCGSGGLSGPGNTVGQYRHSSSCRLASDSVVSALSKDTDTTAGLDSSL
jgi:hypothetical protein